MQRRSREPVAATRAGFATEGLPRATAPRAAIQWLTPSCLRLLVFVALAARFGSAAESPSPDTAQTGASRARALQPHVDRGLQTRFEAAADAIARQQPADAAGVLDRLGPDVGQALVEHDGRHLRLEHAAAILRDQLPEPTRSSLTRSVDQEAERHLAAALQEGSDESLRQLLRTQRLTPAGGTALRLLAARSRDRHATFVASTAFAALSQHRSAGVRERALARLAYWEQLDGSATLLAHGLPAELDPSAEVFPVVSDLSVAAQARMEGLRTRWAARQARALAAVLPPLQAVRWWHEPRPPEPIAEQMPVMLSEYRDQGIVPWSVSNAVLAGENVVARTVAGVLAVDRQTGAVRWQLDDAAPHLMSQNPLFAENLAYRHEALSLLFERWQSDSVWGRISSDGESVYLIEEPIEVRGSRSQEPSPGHRAGGYIAQNATRSTLVRLDGATGKRLWQAGGPNAETSDALAQVLWLGPPLVLGESVFAAGLQGQELKLCVLHRSTGALDWQLSLGQLPFDLESDPARRRIAVGLVATEQRLLLATGSGALLSVDVTSRSIDWLSGYALDESQAPLASPAGEAMYYADDWWQRWRTTRINVAGDLVWCLAPDAQALQVFNLHLGAPIAQIPRQFALDALPVGPTQLLLVEPRRLRLIELRSGREVWAVATAQASGSPAVVPRDSSATPSGAAGRSLAIVLPLANGELLMLDAATGARLSHAARAELPAGNLQYLTDGAGRSCWVSIGLGSLARLSELNDASSPSDPTLAVRSALDRGDYATALRDLTSATPMEVGPSVQNAGPLAQAALGLRLKAGPTERLAAIEALDARPMTDEQRRRTSFEIATAQCDAGEFEAALATALRALDRPYLEELDLIASDGRRVRIDRALNGVIARAFREADVTQRAQLDTMLQQRWQQALDDRDPRVVQRLADVLRPLPWLRRTSLESFERVHAGRPPLQVENRLRELAQDPALSHASWQQLANYWATRGEQKEVAALSERFALQPTQIAAEPDSAPGTSVHEARHGASDPSRQSDIWPQVEQPKVTTYSQRNTDVYQFLLPFQADAASTFERLDVSLERQGRRIRFTGDGQSGPWELALPGSAAPIRYWFHLYHGWSIGRILVTRVGTELFAVTPYEDSGQPSASVLWSVDTLGRPLLLPSELPADRLPAKLGRTVETFRVSDSFGAPIGEVGPVTPGYLCYREQNKIVAIETLTGRWLWELYDIPDDVVLLGDLDHVVLVSPHQRTAAVRSAIDGALLKVRTIEHDASSVYQMQGGRWVWQSGSQLVCDDLVDGQRIWSVALADGSAPFLLNRERLGILDADGSARAIAVETGNEQPFARHLPRPEVLHRIVTTEDATCWYVALSDVVPHEQIRQSAQVRASYRLPFVRGTMAAIDKSTGEIVWTRSMQDEPWPLDQPRTVPVLLQTWKLGSDSPDQIMPLDGIARLIDRRNGRTIAEQRTSSVQGYATLVPFPLRRTVELRLERDSVRVEFAPEPQPPENPPLAPDNPVGGSRPTAP